MSGLAVNVKLEVLVVDEEAPTPLEDGKVRVVPLGQHVEVVPVSELGLDLHHLATHLGPSEGVDVGPVACAKDNQLVRALE